MELNKQVEIDIRKEYLELMKKVLTQSINPIEYSQVATQQYYPIKRFIYDRLIKYLDKRGIHLVRVIPIDPRIREEGKDHPQSAYTMIGLKRLSNIQFCIEDVIKKGIQGDVIETGVWRGGAVIFMRAVLKAYGVVDKKVWVADSFEGLPTPNLAKYPEDANNKFHLMNHLTVSVDQVKRNFQLFDLLDGQVIFLKGWFKDSLPSSTIDKLSVMRLDGDMYESTIDALTNLYPKLSSGGYVIIDDYWDIASCKKAVDDFREQNGITEEILPIDWTGVYWMKGNFNDEGLQK